MMKRVFAVVVTVALCQSVVQAKAVGFDGSQWIWTWPDAGSNDTLNHDMGLVYFRTALDLPADVKPAQAEVFLTADNLFALYVNGQYVGRSEADPNKWNAPKRFDVTGLVKAGPNLLAIEAANTAPGPAGLLLKMVIRLGDGREVVVTSDDGWRCSEQAGKNWQAAAFDDKPWRKAYVVGRYGASPWGEFSRDLTVLPTARPSTQPPQALTWARPSQGGRGRPAPVVKEVPAPDDFAWPEGVVFLGDDCSLYRDLGHTNTSWDSLGVTIFNARNSRSYPEHDLPAPMKMGRKLLALRPARPGVKPMVLLDAGKGTIGSPSVSFDGKSVYVSMAAEGDAFFHIYRVPADGGKPVQLTRGPFHDIDPVELADGRIAFTSTRIGSFEEYHNPPSRSLFAMNVDGSEIRAITTTFIFDNEPEVMHDGRILFVRSDNFFDRGKVETLLHAVHPDGTEGYTEFGLDMGPEYGGRLRAFYCGSPAPMNDGRVAFLTNQGITVAHPGVPQHDQMHMRIDAGDVAATPDNRLLVTTARVKKVELTHRGKPRTVNRFNYEKIAILDPDSRDGAVVVLHDAQDGIHSPVFLGPRARPPLLASKVDRSQVDQPGATGFLFCQNARYTKQTTAGWPHVRAMRVLAGKGLTARSSHAYIVHAGSEVIELGTVPLAPDGSFFVEVPADTAIAFQAVDAEGRSELNEMSWIFVRPGEHRGCLGCHQTRHAAPPLPNGPVQAMTVPPVRLLGKGRPHRFRGNNAAVTGLMEMQWDRYREVASINRHSQTVPPLATGRDEVNQLVAELKHKDPAIRLSACQRLAIFRERLAAAALAPVLKDDDREVRLHAAFALAACGTRDSLPPLLAALNDSDPLVAQAAATGVENLTGSSQPFDAFAPAERRKAQADAWAAAIASAGWDKIEQQLVARLADTDRDVVRRAAVALGHVGADAARKALRDYVARERASNPYPEWRKGHRGDGARFNSLSPANPRTLQAAVRSLGYLADAQAVPMLGETIAANSDNEKGNLFLAEACAEALGRIPAPQAEDALIQSLTGLKDYFYYVGWYGDHGALFACHASPVHYFIAESLDHLASTRARSVVPHLIRSMPTDPDRALLLVSDDCETIVGRVIRRCGAEAAVVDTCLALLGDAGAKSTQDIEDAVRKTYAAWAGHPGPEIRAAQVLSAVCRDRSYEPRVRAALDRYNAQPPTDLVRAFGGGGLPRQLPTRNWVCFFLARTLGSLGEVASVDSLLAVLTRNGPELSNGSPEPDSPAVLFLHNELTPCYRASAAYALGRIGDRRAVGVLLRVVGDLQNALDTRFAAAQALVAIGDPACVAEVRKLADGYPEVSTRRMLLRLCSGQE